MGIVYVGSDHRGYQQKNSLVSELREKGFEIQDLGAIEFDPNDDYTDIAVKLGEKVLSENAKGILFCGSGIGVCVAANKVKSIRAGLCMSEKQAELARRDDDINILCLSADLNAEEDNVKIAVTFLETLFSSDERFIRRINQIKKYESKTDQ